MYSGQSEDVYALSAIRAGAFGYLSKSSNTEYILSAVKKVSEGSMFITNELAQRLAFDEGTKKEVYKEQTDKAKANGISNCPLCAVGNNSNKNKIWTQKEMDADHVAAWSKGGKTDKENCEMLCRTHNRSKGNK